VDGRPKPGTQRSLHLLLRPGSVQGVEGLSARRQRDMSAGGWSGPRVLWHKPDQEAFPAGFTVLGVEVHAGRGILENRARAPGFARQSPVSTLLKELQFELQHIQQVAIIGRHRLILTLSVVLRGR
jgi:hypothetical protein